GNAPLWHTGLKRLAAMLKPDHERQIGDRHADRHRHEGGVVGETDVYRARRIVGIAVVARAALEPGDRRQGELHLHEVVVAANGDGPGRDIEAARAIIDGNLEL